MSARRFWLYGKNSWSGPLVSRVGDEYGNTTACLRLPQGRALIAALNVPLRRHHTVSAITSDPVADMLLIEFQPGEGHARTEKVGASLLANYAADGSLASVEVLSRGALCRPDTLCDLAELMPRYVFKGLVIEAMLAAGCTA